MFKVVGLAKYDVKLGVIIPIMIISNISDICQVRSQDKKGWGHGKENYSSTCSKGLSIPESNLVLCDSTSKGLSIPETNLLLLRVLIYYTNSE